MGPTGGNLPHGQDAGFLGKAYDPFVLNADPSKADFKVPDLLPPAEIGKPGYNGGANCARWSMGWSKILRPVPARN